MGVRASGITVAEIEAVYRADLARFVRTATAIVGDADLGAEVVQDAFAQAMRSQSSFRGRSTLDSWLWRIVVNAALNARRQRRLDRDLSPTESATDPGDELAELADAVRAVLRRLPEQQRLVLFLRYYADLDYETIAATLELAPGTVGATLTAARGRLRGLIQEVLV
jgi:RNA polymerase sigma-70 factor (ECF subfamily)